MAVADLTVERLRELLAYDPKTGIFVRRENRGNNRWKAGTPIGYVDRDGYVLMLIDGARHKAHRLAWLHQHGQHPDGPIDHVNGDRSDNRIANLREATVFLNAQNVRNARADNLAGFLGVSRTRSGRYSATIKTTLAKHQVQLYLGAYDTPETAHEVYLAAKRRLHDGCTI